MKNNPVVEQKRNREDSTETESSAKRQRQADADSDQSDEEAEVERSGTPLSARSRTPSPETENQRIDQDLELEMAKNLAGIPTFPLPTGPAKASAGLLSMQGLPPALRDAERVAQELRIAVKDIEIRQHRRRNIDKGQNEQVNTDGLSSRMRKHLEDSGIEEFFAGEFGDVQTCLLSLMYFIVSVQTALVPELAGLPLVTHADEFLHDYLVSAPTGSGKTLSYVVPLIEVSEMDASVLMLS